MDILEKIEARLERIPLSGCWLWMGAITTQGYGVIRHEGKAQYVHRLMYKLMTGDALLGLFACHRCDTPGCANPHHIMPGDQLVNLRDMAAKGRGRKGKNACGKGHDMTDENAYRAPGGGLQCRACKAERDRKYKMNRRAK